MTGYPVSSQDRAELEEQEAEQRAALAEQRAALAADQLRIERDHARRCVRGWLDNTADDDHPKPCPRCRPHVFTSPCPCCGVVRARCKASLSAGTGRCCEACSGHDR